jgi:hypothetical protein
MPQDLKQVLLLLQQDLQRGLLLQQRSEKPGNLVRLSGECYGCWKCRPFGIRSCCCC